VKQTKSRRVNRRSLFSPDDRRRIASDSCT